MNNRISLVFARSATSTTAKVPLATRPLVVHTQKPPRSAVTVSCQVLCMTLRRIQQDFRMIFRLQHFDLSGISYERPDVADTSEQADVYL